jgi:hypothetical protein
MGNAESSTASAVDSKLNAVLDKIPGCGKFDESDFMDSPSNTNKSDKGIQKMLFNQAETLCATSPLASDIGESEENDLVDKDDDDEYEEFAHRTPQNNNDSEGKNLSSKSANPTSALFARALVSEVTDNPKTMTPAAMAEREKKLLKAQARAKQVSKNSNIAGPRPVGAPGGIGKPSVLHSIANVIPGFSGAYGDDEADTSNPSILPPNSLSENRAQVGSSNNSNNSSNNSIVGNAPGKHTITIGLSLSRRHSIGHPDTTTRQTAFDFNELQDRQYKYVSSTDSSGWRAGGGERGGPQTAFTDEDNSFEEFGPPSSFNQSSQKSNQPPGTPGAQTHKVAAPDTVHIPIIHIDAESPQAVDIIIAAIARGEVFIPHMEILPEALSVNGISPPDLVVRFGTERNDDVPPDEWPNWCLEFMHNQLFEYFQGMGARWMKRPFNITLAKKVRWKTVKHMNRYFAHAERVIDAWREKGPQYLDPQLAYIEGGATPEEVARPHGIYLLRNGVPTNYFAPNFDPPYTTKMTRSLLLNVLGKSWDKKRREWTSVPVPRLVTPSLLITTMCGGCGDNGSGGFMANEVTMQNNFDTSHIPENALYSSNANSTPTSPARHNNPKARPLQLQADDDPVNASVVAETNIAAADPPGPHGPWQPLEAAEEERKPMDPRDDRDEQQSLEQLVEENDQEDAELDDLQYSASQTTAQSVVSSKSPKYGRAPTPEYHRQHGIPEEEELDKELAEWDTVRSAEENAGVLESTTAPSDIVPPSVTGTNSTVMHMNLSANTFMKRDDERRQAREEKKEEHLSAKEAAITTNPNLASDEDWLDAEVSCSWNNGFVGGGVVVCMTHQFLLF